MRETVPLEFVYFRPPGAVIWAVTVSVATATKYARLEADVERRIVVLEEASGRRAWIPFESVSSMSPLPPGRSEER